jgi:uncharacterized membrane protein
MQDPSVARHPDQMPELIAIAYSDETLAGQAAAELERCAAELPIDPDAVGVIACERSGSCQLMTSCHPGATAAWSKFWGALIGVVMNEAEPSEIDADFRRRVRAALKPATSVLFVAVGGEVRVEVLEAVSQYGGESFSCALCAEATAGLWGAPNGAAAQI